MTYAIRWDLLEEDELDVLKRVGVEMHPRAMNFTRTPTWKEFCLVFAYVYGLKDRILDENNHIFFAIGGCINQGKEYFGEEAVDEFIEEHLVICALRDRVLNMTGGTLILQQMIEHQIKFCYTAMPLKGLNLTLEDFISPDATRRKQTLGQITRALKDNNVFGPDFEERLTKFVNSRNEFIHNWWTEQGRRSGSAGGLPSMDEMRETYNFIQSLVKEAIYIRNIFRGFEYELLEAYGRGRMEESKGPSRWEPWSRYVPEFRAALKFERESASGPSNND